MAAKHPVLAFLVLAILTAGPGKAQDSPGAAQPLPFLPHHLSVSLYNGVNYATFKNVYGGLNPEAGSGWVPVFNIQYDVRFDQNHGLGIRTGAGLFPFTFKVKPYREFEIGRENYFWRTDYEPFFNLEGRYHYRKAHGNRSFIQVFAGAGTMFCSEVDAGIHASTKGVELYSFKIEYNNIPKPYLVTGAGLIRAFRYTGMLGLSLGYRYSFTPVYKGYFSLYDAQSAGEITNRGHQFFVDLSYYFTRQEKRSLLNRTPEDQERLAKKTWRKKNRYIDPKSHWVSFWAGPAFVQNRVSNYMSAFIEGKSPGLLLRAGFEKGLDRQFYLELGAEWQQYDTYTALKDSRGHSQGAAFESVQVTGGVLKRLTLATNNFNFCNVQLGLSLNTVTGNTGHVGCSGNHTIDSLTKDTIVVYETHDHVLKRFFATVYAGVSKDIRLGHGLFLCMAYRYNQGFGPVHQQRAVYDPANVNGYYSTTSININGSSHAFLFGLKFNW